MVAFLAVPLIVLLAVSAGTLFLSERIARTKALSDAQMAGVRLALFVVEPVLGGALDGSDGSWRELDDRLRDRLRDRSITSVLIWTSTGRILYSSDPDMIGLTADPQGGLRKALSGDVTADIVNEPDAGYPSGASGPLVEVYVPLRVAGPRFVLETYFAYDAIDRNAMALRDQILPISIGALILLQLVQVPIGISLFRRVQRQDAERAGFLTRSLAASDRERRAIAADVHDGPVQDLAAVGYTLEALRPGMAPEAQRVTDRLTAAVRDAVIWLRRLMIDLYPPDLSAATMPSALEDLARSTRSASLSVQVDALPVPHLSSAGAAVLYRTAKQTLMTTARRNEPGRLRISYGPALLAEGPAVQLRIDYHGQSQGDATRSAGAPDALQLLGSQLRELGGTLALHDDAALGSVMTAVVPAES